MFDAEQVVKVITAPMAQQLQVLCFPFWPNGLILFSIISAVYLVSRRGLIQALRASEAKYRDKVENACEGIIQTSREGKWVFVNTAFARMLGYESAAEILQAVTDIDTQVYVDPLVRRDFLFRLEKYKRAHCEYEAWRKDGATTWLFVSSRVVENKDGKFLYYESIAEDISERRKREAELRQTAEALSQSNAELQRFAHTLAHDLNEPLRTIRLYIELLISEQQARLDKSSIQYMQFVCDAATRMNAFITDILDFSKLGRTKVVLQPVKMQAVVEDVLRNLEIAIVEARANISVRELPEILADRTKVTRLLQNLLTNALKFRAERPLKIVISSEFMDGDWVFSVSDNGMGFDESHKEKMFRLFVRLQDRNRYPGSGMGLAMCKSIVELHGGRIWAESKPGEGSTFYFTLPGSQSMGLSPVASSR